MRWLFKSKVTSIVCHHAAEPKNHLKIGFHLHPNLVHISKKIANRQSISDLPVEYSGHEILVKYRFI